MNRPAYIAFAAVAVLVVVFALMFLSLSAKMETLDKNYQSILTADHDSLTTLHRQLDSLRQQMPGLGEYMSGIQLHVSRLWYSGQALNWSLASYEVNELGEAIEGAEGLHATRDSVNISAVLQSLHNTQLELLRQSIGAKQRRAFLDAYQQTLATCNGCHRAAGYGFIHIVSPTAPPVTNQSWVPENR